MVKEVYVLEKKLFGHLLVKLLLRFWKLEKRQSSMTLSLSLVYSSGKI